MDIRKELKLPTLPPTLKNEIETFNRSHLQHVTAHFVNRSLGYLVSSHGYVVVASRPRTLNIPQIKLRQTSNVNWKVDKASGEWIKKFNKHKKHFITYTNPEFAMRSCYARVIFLTEESSLRTYKVTTKLIQAAKKAILPRRSPKEEPQFIFSELTISALERLQGKEYPSSEHFARALLQARRLIAENNCMPRRDIFIFAIAANTDANYELKKLLKLDCELNEKYFSGKFGAIYPWENEGSFIKADAASFENGEAVSKAYPRVHVSVVYDLLQQQYMHRAYIEKQAGIGISYALLDEKEQQEEKSPKKSDADLGAIDEDVRVLMHKCSVRDEDAEKLIGKLPKFIFFPAGKNPGTANCNKSAATFLQEAEYISAHEDKRAVETITGASKSCVGASQRMLFWRAVPTGHDKIILQLFYQPDFKIADEKLLQQLADMKEKILQMAQQQKEDVQQKLYRRMIDIDSNLGMIFYHRRTGMMRDPDVERGYLRQIRERIVERPRLVSIG